MANNIVNDVYSYFQTVAQKIISLDPFKTHVRANWKTHVRNARQIACERYLFFINLRRSWCNK